MINLGLKYKIYLNELFIYYMLRNSIVSISRKGKKIFNKSTVVMI